MLVDELNDNRSSLVPDELRVPHSRYADNGFLSCVSAETMTLLAGDMRSHLKAIGKSVWLAKSSRMVENLSLNKTTPQTDALLKDRCLVEVEVRSFLRSFWSSAFNESHEEAWGGWWGN